MLRKLSPWTKKSKASPPNGLPSPKGPGPGPAQQDDVTDSPSNTGDKAGGPHPPSQGPLDLKSLAVTLRVDPDACGPAASAEDLFRESAAKHFPSPPPEGDGALSPERLDQHLSSDVQRAVSGELRRLRPLLRGELGGVVRAYHRHAMQHVLLPQVTATSQLALVLMKWLCNVYFSKEFLGDPDFREDGHRSTVDMHLYCETVTRLSETLLTALQREVQSSLDDIAQRQESEHWESTELHTAVIKCMDEPVVKAEAISENLQERARRICFLPLQDFLERFNKAKQDILKGNKENPKMAVETCLKTLITCHCLASHIQTHTDAEKTLSSLKSMETAAQKSMEDAVAQITKDLLKRHFKTSKDEFLLSEMKQMFSAGDRCPDVLKRVLDLTYEQVSALYLSKLVSTKRKELEKRWSRGGVGPIVTRDAEQLHQMFSDLHPGVSQHNHVLQKVEELLEIQDVDAVKLTLCLMMQLCQSRKVKALLPDLLTWKGLSRCQVQEVREAVPGLSARERTRTLRPSCISTSAD